MPLFLFLLALWGAIAGAAWPLHTGEAGSFDCRPWGILLAVDWLGTMHGLPRSPARAAHPRVTQPSAAQNPQARMFPCAMQTRRPATSPLSW